MACASLKILSCEGRRKVRAKVLRQCWALLAKGQRRDECTCTLGLTERKRDEAGRLQVQESFLSPRREKGFYETGSNWLFPGWLFMILRGRFFSEPSYPFLHSYIHLFSNCWALWQSTKAAQAIIIFCIYVEFSSHTKLLLCSCSACLEDFTV